MKKSPTNQMSQPRLADGRLSARTTDRDPDANHRKSIRKRKLRSRLDLVFSTFEVLQNLKCIERNDKSLKVVSIVSLD